MHGKRFGALLTAGCILLSALPLSAGAQEEAWDGQAADQSWYTDAAELHLDTAAELAGLAKLVNAGTDFSGQTVYLDADVDLGGHDWTPIGQVTALAKDSIQGSAFAGVFDGQGHTVHGLSLKFAEGNLGYGLFGYSTGSISDVSVASDGVIDLSGVTADLTPFGAIVGFNNGGTVSRCTSAARITDDGTETDTRRSLNVGGIVGINDYGGVVEYCVNLGSIHLPSVKARIGGVVGSSCFSSNATTTTIQYCVNYGGITAGLCDNIGGICSFSRRGVIRYCYNRGDLKLESGEGAVGGIAGVINHQSLTCCYNTGTMQSTARNTRSIVGSGNDPSTATCFGLSGTLSADDVWCVDGETLKANVLALDAADDGNAYAEDSQGINDGYPVLSWQLDNGEAADQAAADRVSAIIAALPALEQLTVDDQAAIKEAREAYEALRAAQKELVTNLDVLEQAEERLAELLEALKEKNLALGKPAEATYEQMDGEYQAYAANAVDGDYHSRWSTFGAPSLPGAIQVDLRAVCEVESVATYWFGVGRTYTYSIYLTDEPMIVDSVLQTTGEPVAADLTGQGSGTANSSTSAGTPGSLRTEYTFPEKVTGRYLTIVCTNVAGGNAAVLWELEVNGVQVGETVQAAIASISGMTGRRVAFGTEMQDIVLPDKATVSLDNGQKGEVSLRWACADYNPRQPGTYTFVGTPVLDEEGEITNPAGITASLPVTVCEEEADLSGRQVVSISNDWTFMQGTLAGAEAPAYNDAAWEQLDLPHTWNAQDGQDGGNNYYRGDGWYRKVLDWNPDYAGKRIDIEFLGACLQADVYVNGQFMGNHKGGYTAFRFDITDALIPGQENIIAVRVNNQQTQDIAPLSGDFTVFGGIYREVSLVLTDSVHIDTADYGSSGLYLTQTNVSEESADLEIRSNIVNDGEEEKTVTVRATLRHPDTFEEIDTIPNPAFDPADMVGGGIVESYETQLTIPAGESAAFVHDLTVEAPHLWNGREDPYRYQVDLEVFQEGERVDNQTGYVGFRYYTVDYDEGFFLNGESYPLRGVSRHQDWEDMGTALTQREHNIDFGLIYEIGANAVRLAHYPQAPYFYELCDKYGIVVWAEIPFVNNVGGSGTYEDPDADRQAFFQVTKQQLIELIRQQYNRPSICFWGLQNEVLEYAECMPEFMAELNDLAHKEDPTRLTTQATDKDAAKNWASDLIAWNRYPGWYFGTKEDMGADLDKNHAGDDRPFGISEYGIGSNIEIHVDKATNADKSLGAVQPEEYQNICHESFIPQINERSYLWATFNWNMFDFSSDMRAEGGLTGVNTKGLVTRDREVKKDSFYLYKANWSDQPFVYITSRRNDVRQNSPVEIKGYSNCDSVELTVNGQVIGRLSQEDLAQETVFVWEDVPLANGENTIVMTAEKDGETYTDTVVWEKQESADTSLWSDALLVDNAARTISLTADVQAEDLQEVIHSYGALLELFSETGRRVTSGPIRAGMILQVISEDESETALYIFVNPCLTQDKPIEASSYQDNQNGNNPPEYMNDGDDTTRWAAGLTEDGGNTSYPQWVEIDLGDLYALDRIDVSWFQGSSSKRAYTYTVSVSEDGEDYRQAVDRSENTVVGVVSDSLDGVKARYIRLDITGNSEWSGSGSAAASIYEIRAYGEKTAAVEPADKEALQKLYDQHKGDAQGTYTDESWQVFLEKLDGAEKVLENPDATQAEIDQALQALTEAIAGRKEEIPDPTLIPGDMDGNGKVTITDVMQACRVLARKNTGERPTPEEIRIGDLDGDKDITITDIMGICRILARGENGADTQRL